MASVSVLQHIRLLHAHLEAIWFIRSAFQSYGMAFILREGEVFRMYAGGEEVVSKNKLYESIVRPEEFDPYLWTVRNKVIQIYKDITRNPNYRAIPILNRAELVAIIPLTYQYETFGAMGIYAGPGQVLTHEDAISSTSAMGAVDLRLAECQPAPAALQHPVQPATLAGVAVVRWSASPRRDRGRCATCWRKSRISGTPSCGLTRTDRGNYTEVLADTKNSFIVQNYEPLRKRGMVGAVVQAFADETQPTIIEVDTSQDRVVHRSYRACYRYGAWSSCRSRVRGKLSAA